MRVMKYLRGHIPSVVVIVLLLVAQSFCELSLPAYTSRIVDTGIQGGGIESATPLVLTDKTMDGVRLFLSDEDAQTVSDAYTYDNGIWTLGDTARQPELEPVFIRPLVMYARLSEQGANNVLALRRQMQGGLITHEEILARGEEALSGMGVLTDSVLRSAAMQFLKTEYAVAGLNVNHMRTSYLLRTGGRMLLLTLGMIASFLTLSRGFTNPISQISNQFNSIVTALAGASRIFAFMDAEPETDDGYVTLVNATEENGMLAETDHHTGLWAWKHPHGDGTVTYTKLAGRVVFDHVDFGYTPDKEVLHDITLYAEPGQKVAFVGATGAGKTTITNLINRFYDIADGKIRYDGININKICKEDLRRSLGIVLQDVNLFTGTVMENIRYGNPAATDDECIAAAKLANADHFIRMLPDGYNTVLKGDGSGLSQGQRQLLSIARAAVSDPPVMILDEATSSIDTRTEAIVQRGMDQLMEGRTVFVIAHRLSTVKNSDVIMVLDHGRIIERGSHEKLIAERGTYYQLYTGAFELE